MADYASLIRPTARHPAYTSGWRHGFLDLRDQRAERKGLWQEGKLLVLRQALVKGLFGIARDEDDLEVGVALAHFLEQRRAVHFRHHHVGDDEIDRAVL